MYHFWYLLCMNVRYDFFLWNFSFMNIREFSFHLFNLSIIILLISIIFSLILLCLTHSYSAQDFLRNNATIILLKSATYFSLLFVAIIQIFFWFFYLEVNSKSLNLMLFDNLNYYEITPEYFSYIISINHHYGLFFSEWKISIDLFGLIIQFAGLVVGFLSYLVLDTRFFFKNIKYLTIFCIFDVVVLLFTTTNNVIYFFLYYELLLLPSFLLVYYISQARRATQAALYFVIWTQTGSFLVLCATAYLITITNMYTFSELKYFKFTQSEVYFLFILYFFGFGFKVPIWPLHFWLTKTHVEAPAGFSMYLSGFLVKTALYGFFKYTSIFGLGMSTTPFILITGLGVIDASIKMFAQVDLKKLVAFCTIQEMNLIYLMLCWGDSFGIITAMLFILTHAFLSSLMFFIVDCVQRRYNSRSILELSGILHTSPNLGILLFFMCVLYSGLPGTIKFVCEFYLFGQLIGISLFFTFFLLVFANLIGVLGFCRCFFNVIFGMSLKYARMRIIDLNFKDLYISFICIFFLIVLPYAPLWFF